MAKAKAPKVKRVEFDLAPHQVLVAPKISEKNTHLAERRNTYVFKVHMHATKEQIKSAIEAVFEVGVVAVRTQVRKGKERRFKNKVGMTSDAKLAMVTLQEDDRIQLF